ncbi:hypothetical protein HYH03_007437 [Edaphochlamys debaryana]|uniref:Uncharacterized protein n=1 Tax=Edaphochlamys debaryana TaxID=47281 RepID=A0A836BZW4_9CHLO|nr:hypothetical protein HYH03_007437 [Edaphochlamys debaryana]|eukprot:KAG2494382.1 hypothetical protein HYH03_007437 [Edaphochlamys debaryana]
MLGGLILATSLIGPLLVGIAFTTVAIGAALSAGALFTSLFLPFFVMAGMGALFFGITTFSAFATLGTALLLPNLISLAVAGAGLGLGAMAVGLVLRPAAERAKDRYNEEGNGQADSGRRGKVTSGEPEVTVEVDPETDRQLKEFDELLKDREAARRRAERFRQGR